MFNTEKENNKQNYCQAFDAYVRKYDELTNIMKEAGIDTKMLDEVIEAASNL